MLTFPIKYPQRRSRRKEIVPAPVPPPLVTVVSVTGVGDQQALWVFSSAVLSADEALGLSVSSQAPDVWEVTGDGAILATYSDLVVVGAVWEATSDDPVEIMFASGQELVLPESGTVE